MTPDRTIRPATPADGDAVAHIAVASTLFAPDEMAGFPFEPAVGDNRWIVVERGGAPIGAAFYAPEPFSDRIWNLYFIAVVADEQGTGAGTDLMAHVEGELRDAGPAIARSLIVETSSLERFAATRRFYLRRGYERVGRIPGFYGPGDDKVVFWRALGGG